MKCVCAAQYYRANCTCGVRKLRHKLTITSVPPSRMCGFRRWYVECSCDWQPKAVSEVTGLFARATMDAALAVGIAHQKEQQ